jgi:PAS domain S-box-containing protein
MEHLERQSKSFAHFAEIVPDAIVFGDLRGRITYCNSAAERMFGHSSLVGSSLTVLMPERFHSAHNAGMERFATTGEPTLMGRIVELVGRRSSGEEFPIEVSFSAEGVGDERTLVALVRDISARKRTEVELVRRAEEIERLKRALEVERDHLREEVREIGAFGDIIGNSAALRTALEMVDAVARTDASVLIQGESGVGKELFARALHERSARADRPLVKVNCATVPKELFESEFFGHVKGAFTGAHKPRDGRFATADGGTLFLDEVGEIPLELQSKLLRVLQEQEFERVGDDTTHKVDVRVVAATNRDLAEEVGRGAFRQDLYYRLSVFPIAVPPLRERLEDVPDLARHFILRSAHKLKIKRVQLEPHHEARLRAYRWPGNVRELQNVIERASILALGGELRLDLALPVIDVN